MFDPSTFEKLTLPELQAIMSRAGAKAETYLEPLNQTMCVYEISSRLRKSAFLAQLAHESGELRYMAEIASGAAYEGRIDLGNTHKGDGVRFKGRGLIQVTGRANYESCAASLGMSLTGFEAYVMTPEGAAMSAGWFWNSRMLNALADSKDFIRITKKINGGTNGLSERQAYYRKALEALE